MKLNSHYRGGGIVPFLVTVIIFGIFVPWWKGIEFFDPLLLLVSFLVPAVFVTPVATEERVGLTSKGRVEHSFLYSGLMTLLIAFHGVAVVNVTHWFGHLLLPPSGVLISGLLVAIGTELFLALGSVWLFQRSGAKRTRLVVRSIFFVLLGMYLYLFRFAPISVRSQIDEHLTSETLTWTLLVMTAVLTALSVILLQSLRTGEDRRVE